jgi:hypothetical protein
MMECKDMAKMAHLIVFVFFLFWARAGNAQSYLWSAGMESGNLNEWSVNDCGGEFNSGVSNSEASRKVANTGSWAAHMTITTPSIPTSGTRLFRWCEPQNNPRLYYSTWFYFPARYSVTNFWNIFQWKSKTSSRNDPFFVVNVGNRPDGSMYLYMYDWQNRASHGQQAVNLPVGQWVQIEAYYQCAADSTGHVTVWQDGALLFDVPNVPTRYADGDCQWSVDNYSDGIGPKTASLYIDDAAISLTRIGAVTPPPTPTVTQTARCKPKRKCRRR